MVATLKSTSGRCRSGSPMPGWNATGSSAVPRDFGPLRERNFRLLAGARTISFFGTNLAPIAVAFAVLDLTGSATDVGIAFACWTLAQVSTLLIGGPVADPLPRRLLTLSSVSANLPIRAAVVPP